MERQLDAIRRLDIEKLVCVVGYEKAMVKQVVRQLWDGLVLFIENPKYETTNTIYSLYLAIEHINEDFVYMNGDVVFRPDLVDRIVEQEGDGVLGIVGKRCGNEEVKVVVQDGRIIRIGKKLSPHKCCGEFIGIALFRKGMLDLLSESLQNIVEDRGLVDEYFEASLSEIKDKVFLRAADITDVPCIEIDFPEDLKQAQENSIEFDESD